MQMKCSRTSQLKREQDDLLRVQAACASGDVAATTGSLLQSKVSLENAVNTQLGRMKLAATALDAKYLELVESYKKVVDGLGENDTWKEAKQEVDAAKAKVAAQIEES